MSAFSRRRLLQLGAHGFALLGARSALGARSFAGGEARLGASRHSGALIATRLTHQYGLRHPFVSAGMGFVGTAPLTAAVTNAGGMGVLGVGAETPERMHLMIQEARSLTGGLFGVDLINATGAGGPFTTELHVELCILNRIPVVAFHWELPPRAWVERLQAAGTRVWMQVGSVPDALGAAALGVDAIITQGSGAGGHNRGTAPTLTLLRDVRGALGPSMILLAAGGIADGHDVARALVAGADGVWVGTRLIASVEAYAHGEYKNRILQAGPSGTVLTPLFGPEWPGQPMRVLRNRVVREWAGREHQVPTPPPPPAVIGTTMFRGLPYAMPKFSAVVPTPDTRGDFDEMCLTAGEGAGRIAAIQPAAAIVHEMMTGAAALLLR